MRFAGNFHPEWGYLAPAPSFMRTVRIVVVAAAVGATAGAGVVFSLVDRPALEEQSVAMRTLVRSANPAPGTSPVELQVPNPTATLAAPKPDDAAIPASEAEARPTATQRPVGIAAVTEAPAAIDAPQSQAVDPTPAAPPSQKKKAKRQHTAPRREEAYSREEVYSDNGPFALMHPFNSRPPSASFWR